MINIHTTCFTYTVYSFQQQYCWLKSNFQRRVGLCYHLHPRDWRFPLPEYDTSWAERASRSSWDVSSTPATSIWRPRLWTLSPGELKIRPSTGFHFVRGPFSVRWSKMMGKKNIFTYIGIKLSIIFQDTVSLHKMTIFDVFFNQLFYLEIFRWVNIEILDVKIVWINEVLVHARLVLYRRQDQKSKTFFTWNL